MAKPYRRRKGKNFVGNFRCDINGADVNLETKDANEAYRRAKLCAKGEWSPKSRRGSVVAESAAVVAQAALDPTAPDHETAGHADLPAALGGGGPQTTPSVHLPPSPAVITPPQVPAATAERIEDAAAAAAAEVAGAEEGERVEAAQITREAAIDAKLSALMGKLAGADGGTDLAAGVCSMAADFLLVVEKKTIEWGGTWALRRRGGKGVSMVAGDPPELARQALALGLQAYAVRYLPDFADRLTPGWAVAIGLAVGGSGMVMNASIVKRDADGKVVETTPAAPPAPNAETTAPASA